MDGNHNVDEDAFQHRSKNGKGGVAGSDDDEDIAEKGGEDLLMREVKPLELGRTLRGNGKALAEDGNRGGRRAAGWFNMRRSEDDDQRKYAKRRGGTRRGHSTTS